MTVDRCVRILEALAAGLDPATGVQIDEDSVLDRPEIMLALLMAAEIVAKSRPDRLSSGFGARDVSTESAATSLVHLAKETFGICIEKPPRRFIQEGWFHTGLTPLTCPHCRIRLQGFRMPYRSAGKIYHYWGLICVN